MSTQFLMIKLLYFVYVTHPSEKSFTKNVVGKQKIWKLWHRNPHKWMQLFELYSFCITWIYMQAMVYSVFFQYGSFFDEHSRFIGQQGKVEVISLIPL